MESVISFRGLTKIYAYGFWGKKQKALDQLTLEVPKGSIYGFLGANGAGKTTAIKILMGLQFSTSGECLIFGKDPLLPEVKSRIGYLPERPYFHDNMTANTFLDFHRDLFGSSLHGRKLPSNEELLEMVGLSQVAGKSLKDFSKGMLQRAGIAQALVNDPDLVVLDEPMSGLDPVGRREVRDLILELGTRGKTVFFSSHILSDVESVCHRFAFLEKGVLKYEGGLDEIRKGGSSKHEVQFAGISEEKISSTAELKNSIKSGSSFLLLCDDAQAARRAVEAVWALGGQLISYHPQQRTLEDFLFGKDENEVFSHR